MKTRMGGAQKSGENGGLAAELETWRAADGDEAKRTLQFVSSCD